MLFRQKNINHTFKNYFEPLKSEPFAHKGEIRSLKTPQLQTGKKTSLLYSVMSYQKIIPVEITHTSQAKSKIPSFPLYWIAHN